MIQLILGKTGLVTINGKEHLARRKIINPTFNHASVRSESVLSLSDVINVECNQDCYAKKGFIYTMKPLFVDTPLIRREDSVTKALISVEMNPLIRTRTELSSPISVLIKGVSLYLIIIIIYCICEE